MDDTTVKTPEQAGTTVATVREVGVRHPGAFGFEALSIGS